MWLALMLITAAVVGGTARRWKGHSCTGWGCAILISEMVVWLIAFAVLSRDLPESCHVLTECPWLDLAVCGAVGFLGLVVVACCPRVRENDIA
jgi:hypothetical protein